MIPLKSFYDEYIDRRKFTEQKKTIWVYSSSLPPPIWWGRNKKLLFIKELEKYGQLKKSWKSVFQKITHGIDKYFVILMLDTWTAY